MNKLKKIFLLFILTVLLISCNNIEYKEYTQSFSSYEKFIEYKNYYNDKEIDTINLKFDGIDNYEYIIEGVCGCRKVHNDKTVKCKTMSIYKYQYKLYISNETYIIIDFLKDMTNKDLLIVSSGEIKYMGNYDYCIINSENNEQLTGLAFNVKENIDKEYWKNIIFNELI